MGTRNKLFALALCAGFIASASVMTDPSQAADRGPAPVVKDGRQLYLMVDKPMYRPGETIWFRTWEVASAGLTQAGGKHAVTYKLIDPRGSTVAEKKVRSNAGMATNDIVLGADMPGGSYKLVAESATGPSVERTLIISTYELPRITKTLEFLRSSFAAGDRVVATVQLQKTGKPLRRARVTATAWLDGRQIARTSVRSDRSGSATIRFRLPGKIARGDGLLTLSVDDGGSVEAMQRRIPIVVDKVHVGLFPEGGDLVAGIESRVYFAATDMLGEPIDVRGVIVDDTGAKVASIRSAARGMGRFSITPKTGRSYSLKLRKPARISQAFPLPSARASGCVMATSDDFAGKGAGVSVKVTCTDKRAVSVSAHLRGQKLGVAKAAADPSAELSVAIPAGSVGALRLTASADKRPVAERLVYRGLGEDLRVTIHADRESYGPRDKVTLTVKAATPSGEPAAADLALAVVDDAVLNLADDRTGNILAQMYLLPEMPRQTIREPNFYFSKDPKAPQAMDLLLGTQGWRRFRTAR